MAPPTFRERLAVLADLGAAYSAEIPGHDPAAPTAWPLWPDAAALTDHLGGNHRWAAAMVRTGERVDRRTVPPAPTDGVRAWFDDGVHDLLGALDEAGPDRPTWRIGVDPAGTTGFWARRMVIETAKHLADLRAGDSRRWTAPPELPSAHAADAVDELFEVFLPRSRPTLATLPGALRLRADDIRVDWVVGEDWTVRRDPAAPSGDAAVPVAQPVRADALETATTHPAATVSGGIGDLLLLCWERAAPADPRLRIEGDAGVVDAFAASPVHP